MDNIYGKVYIGGNCTLQLKHEGTSRQSIVILFLINSFIKAHFKKLLQVLNYKWQHVFSVHRTSPICNIPKIQKMCHYYIYFLHFTSNLNTAHYKFR